MATASDIIMAMAAGMKNTGDGTVVSPVVWRVRDEGYQKLILAAISEAATRDAATLAAVQALADVIKAGGGSVDSAAIVAAINDAAARTHQAITDELHAVHLTFGTNPASLGSTEQSADEQTPQS